LRRILFSIARACGDRFFEIKQPWIALAGGPPRGFRCGLGFALPHLRLGPAERWWYWRQAARPWATGNLILDPSGHLSFFLIGKDQPKTGSSVRTPLGPLVAYDGTYTIDEPNAMLTYKIEHGASPLCNGATRTQKVTFKATPMVTTGSEVETPEGKMTPVNEWKRAKNKKRKADLSRPSRRRPLLCSDLMGRDAEQVCVDGASSALNYRTYGARPSTP